jgi:hypothetical protein
MTRCQSSRPPELPRQTSPGSDSVHTLFKPLDTLFKPLDTSFEPLQAIDDLVRRQSPSGPLGRALGHEGPVAGLLERVWLAHERQAELACVVVDSYHAGSLSQSALAVGPESSPRLGYLSSRQRLNRTGAVVSAPWPVMRRAISP